MAKLVIECKESSQDTLTLERSHSGEEISFTFYEHHTQTPPVTFTIVAQVANLGPFAEFLSGRTPDESLPDEVVPDCTGGVLRVWWSNGCLVVKGNESVGEDDDPYVVFIELTPEAASGIVGFIRPYEAAKKLLHHGPVFGL